MGDYQIKPKKPYWIYGLVGYSFVGASVGMYYNSINNYDKYLEANTISEKNDYYQNALNSKNLSYAFIGVAGLVWAIDYIGIIKRKKEIKGIMEKKCSLPGKSKYPRF